MPISDRCVYPISASIMEAEMDDEESTIINAVAWNESAQAFEERIIALVTPKTERVSEESR